WRTLSVRIVRSPLNRCNSGCMVVGHAVLGYTVCLLSSTFYIPDAAGLSDPHFLHPYGHFLHIFLRPFDLRRQTALGDPFQNSLFSGSERERSADGPLVSDCSCHILFSQCHLFVNPRSTW